MRFCTILMSLFVFVHLSAFADWEYCTELDSIRIWNVVELSDGTLAANAYNWVDYDRHIYFSTDQGKTWDIENGKTTPEQSSLCVPICFSDDNTIWALDAGTNDDKFQQNHIFNSTDQGNTWTTIGLPIKVQWFALDFLNNDFGVLVGYDGTILKTANAGVDWESIDIGTKGNLTDVKLIDGSNWFIIDNTNGKLFKTSTGGSTWEEVFQAPKLYRIENDAENIFTISTFTSNFFISKNGGIDWDKIEMLPFLVNGTYTSCMSVCFLDEDHGWVGTWKSDIYATNDGGKTWTCQLEVEDNSGFGQCQIYDICMLDLNNGFAAGSFFAYAFTGNNSVEDDFIQSSKTTVYPNPARNQIQINSDYNINMVKIYDVKGVLRIAVDSKNINISDLSSGTYFIVIESGGEIIAREKFIVE